MITTWLSSEFTDIYAKNPNLRIILWFDPKEEFARLLDDGSFPPKDAGFTLLRYDLDMKENVFHGPLWLKAQMVWETHQLPHEERAGKRYVLYLPFSREKMADDPNLESLTEFAFSGKTWLIDSKDTSLFSFLRKRGVSLPQVQKEQRALWEGGKESILAKFTAQFASRDAAFWKQPLDTTKINQLLVGDLDERLFKVLADPDNAAAYLTESDLLTEFTQAMQDRFGYVADLASNPRAWVEGFTVRLALAECYEGYGEPDDFPFSALVPDALHRPNWLAFFKRWTSDRDLSGVYNKIVRIAEPQYSLKSWAANRVGESQAFYHLSQSTWDDDRVAFEAAAGSRSQLEAYAQKNAITLRKRADGYWSKGTNAIPGWSLLADLSELTLSAQAAVAESQNLTTPNEFVNAYTNLWHTVDAAYWNLFQAVRQMDGMETVLQAANLVYSHYLREVNNRFVARLAKWPNWSGWGPLLSTTASVNVWKTPKGKTAVVIVDALRYDLALTLKDKIEGAEVSAAPWITSAPSITPVGMTAMLPLQGDKIAAVLSGTKLELADPPFGNLTIREKRKALLSQRNGVSDFLDLADLLSASKLPTTRMLVVFTSEIDELGHKTGRELAKYLEQMVTDLRFAVEKLHRSGFDTVHIVSDHGFILLADSGDEVTIPAKQYSIRGERYFFLAEGAVVSDDLFTLPFPLDERLRVAFAPGIACFEKPSEYLHGGMSLQEIVVPHLTSFAAQKPEKMRVQCALPSAQVATLSIKVLVVGEPPQTGSLFGQPVGRTVEVTFLRSGKPVAETKKVVIAPSSEEETQSVTVFLDDEIDFKKGDVLTLHVRDVDTQEDLGGGKTVTLLRDLGG